MPVTFGFRQTITVLDTVAFRVFFIYLFTVTASINFYAYFCSFFWQGLHLLAFSALALKRGAFQIVVLLTGFCVKREKTIGK